MKYNPADENMPKEHVEMTQLSDMNAAHNSVQNRTNCKKNQPSYFIVGHRAALRLDKMWAAYYSPVCDAGRRSQPPVNSLIRPPEAEALECLPIWPFPGIWAWSVTARPLYLLCCTPLGMTMSTDNIHVQ